MWYRVEGAGADLHVVRLHDDAAFARPVICSFRIKAAGLETGFRGLGHGKRLKPLLRCKPNERIPEGQPTARPRLEQDRSV